MHELGARIPHEFKDILLLLNALRAMAERAEGRDPAMPQALIERQLPAIAQQLMATLSTLRRQY